jgi:hypothetical protein
MDQFSPLLSSRTLEKHRAEYLVSRQQIQEQMDNIDEIIDVKSYLGKNMIQCLKNNYALDSDVQNQHTFEALIEL